MWLIVVWTMVTKAYAQAMREFVLENSTKFSIDISDFNIDRFLSIFNEYSSQYLANSRHGMFKDENFTDYLVAIIGMYINKSNVDFSLDELLDDVGVKDEDRDFFVNCLDVLAEIDKCSLQSGENCVEHKLANEVTKRSVKMVEFELKSSLALS